MDNCVQNEELSINNGMQWCPRPAVSQLWLDEMRGRCWAEMLFRANWIFIVLGICAHLVALSAHTIYVLIDRNAHPKRTPHNPI